MKISSIQCAPVRSLAVFPLKMGVSCEKHGGEPFRRMTPKRIKTPEEWSAIESRAVALIVLSRVLEDDLEILISRGLDSACFTVDEYQTIVGKIVTAMNESRGMVQGIADAAQSVPEWFWRALIGNSGLAGPWREGGAESYQELAADHAPLFARPEDFRPLIFRRKMMIAASNG